MNKARLFVFHNDISRRTLLPLEVAKEEAEAAPAWVSLEHL